MGNIIASLLTESIFFMRAMFGVINAPYVTYRKLSSQKLNGSGVFYIFVISILYFVWANLIRSSTPNPSIVSSQILHILFGATSGVVFCLLFLWICARIYKLQGSVQTLGILYAYSLIPTLVWFFTTSLLYIILPPPRSLLFWGKALSVVYIAFSIGLLCWKSILYYLTLRFTYRIGFGGFVRMSLLFLPTLIIYALSMYWLGVFKIPFV